jgi:class 3 adenylate cyclase
VTSEAAGGQIVVADVVRQLVAGKDFLFGDRGETPLKGIQAPIRTWELLWRLAKETGASVVRLPEANRGVRK